MQNKLIFILASSLLILCQCELFLGQRPDGVVVTIDLGEAFANSRDIQLAPDYTHCTAIKLTVFGEGMARLEKSVSPGTRYLTLTVPAGKERYFTLESFIAIDSEIFPYSHVRSFKGRAIADLEPGKIVVLKLKMVAGATDLLVPDYNSNSLKVFKEFFDNSYTTIDFSYPYLIRPADLDLLAKGTISLVDDNSSYIATLTSPQTTPAVHSTYPYNPSASAGDRDAGFDIDANSTIDYDILYFASGSHLFFFLNNLSTLMVTPNISVKGMAVDPWTHRLYLVGLDQKESPCLVEYDPTYKEKLMTGGYKYGRVLRTISHPNFRSLQDVIVKDEYIFILNEITDHQNDLTTPVLLKFDRKLNYLAGFGTVSVDVENDYILKESNEPGKFYHPKRFFAHENEGLYIIDDTNYEFDRIVFINTDLDPKSWKANCPKIDEVSIFSFFDSP